MQNKSATPALTPKQAAAVASGVYLLRNMTVAEATSQRLDLGCEGIFQIGGNSRFQGRSGAALYRPLSGFGYITEGVGEFKGHILCATRGTDTIADWLTDFCVGMHAGPSGSQVHIGFHETWKSYIDEVRKFLRDKNPTHIHCVGHSLGGALAMLNADYFASNKVAPVTVYTFGAPRVGSSTFSSVLTQRAANIFRVSHVADPVAMIPTAPFFHAPYASASRVVGSGLFSFAAHKMVKSYVPLVQGLSWGNFPTDATQVPDEKVKVWLASAASAGVVKMYSAHALHMIGASLQWLLKQVGYALGAGIATLTAGFTVLDRIAWMLHQGIKLTKELSGYGLALIGAVMRFLGRAANTAQELTIQYLRWVFSLLFTTISTAASLAVGFANRGD